MSNFLLKADSTIQGLLLLAIFILAPTIFVPPLLMIPLGGWQVSSALIKGLAWRSRLHLTYFGLAALYCLALWAGFSGFVEINLPPGKLADFLHNGAWALFFVLVIPFAAAVIYWKISVGDNTHYEEKLV
ncbi:MAG: hypothetical protein J5I98_08260 [Phaeodactylibacter sp.]|nr:hypothetical protein [Phaeodactylibacter sp.]